MTRILLLMVLCHIVDDFVLQPICLSKLKQKSWWEENAPDELYKYDYKAALLIHSISWSIMIILPYILFNTYANDTLLLISVVVNTIIHYITDNAKANKKKINLEVDQVIHFSQIFITFIFISSEIYTCWLN